MDRDSVKEDSTEEEDKARLLSVQAYAERQTVALFRTPGATQSEIGYLNVTICSNRGAKEATASSPAVPSPFTFTEPNSATYADCQKMRPQETRFVHFIGPCRFRGGHYAKLIRTLFSI